MLYLDMKIKLTGITRGSQLYLSITGNLWIVKEDRYDALRLESVNKYLWDEEDGLYDTCGIWINKINDQDFRYEVEH